MQKTGARTLSEFCITVQDERLREALKQYTVDGRFPISLFLKSKN